MVTPHCKIFKWKANLFGEREKKPKNKNEIIFLNQQI